MKLTPLSWKDLEWTNRIIPSRENDSKKKILLKITAIVSTVFLIFLVTLTVDVSKALFAKLFGRCQPMKDLKQEKKSDPQNPPEPSVPQSPPEPSVPQSPPESSVPQSPPEPSAEAISENNTTADQTQTPIEPIPPLIAYLKTIVTKESIAKIITVAIKGLRLAPENLHENLLKEPDWYKKALLVMGATIPFWIATNDLKWALFTSASYYGSVIGYNIARAKIEQFTSKMRNNAPSTEFQEAGAKVLADVSKVVKAK